MKLMEEERKRWGMEIQFYAVPVADGMSSVIPPITARVYTLEKDKTPLVEPMGIGIVAVRGMSARLVLLLDVH